MRGNAIRKALVWAVIAQLIAPGAPMVWAQDGSNAAELLAEGKRQYEELEWETAVVTLQRALVAGLSREDQADAYWHLALTARALDDLDAAEDYFYELLRAQPDFELPESARGTDFEPLFAAALSRADRAAPTLNLLPPSEVERGKPVKITAEVMDDSAISEVVLAFRIPGSRDNTIVALTLGKDGRWSGEIPAAAAKESGALQYTVSATDEWDNTASQQGTVVIPEDSGGSGMMWVLIGAVLAAGGGLAAAFLGGGSADPGGDGNGNGNDGTTWPLSSPPGPPQ